MDPDTEEVTFSLDESRLRWLPEDEELKILGRLGSGSVGSHEVQDVLKSFIENPCASLPLSGVYVNWVADHEIVRDSTTEAYQGLHDDELGCWPRRLLHVPTMTSLEWQPGNIYGDHIAPAYSAVSYTWGRYDLDIPGAKRQRKFRKVRGIKIMGIDWSVPRINPVEQFSVDQFYNLIKRTCDPVGDGDIRTDFLWLDVACIDQNNGPQKMAEIGRQAVIFEGAHRVFVWLTKLRAEKLNHTIDILARSCDSAVAFAEAKQKGFCSPNDMMDWAGAARASLDELFIDPWFTSLWTLQEAFLCPKAYLLPLEATLIRPASERESNNHPVTLSDLYSISAGLSQVVVCEQASVERDWQADQTNADLTKQAKYLNEVNAMLTQRGLTALATRSPIALYNVAQYRRTRAETDRVYGIQQVFHLRLGLSAPGCNGLDPKLFHRSNLEDELGAALAEDYPVASQLHYFTQPADEGTGWRMSASSQVPRLEIKSSIWSLRFHAMCVLSTKKIKAQRHGIFNGQICDLAQLAVGWRRLHHDSHVEGFLGVGSPQQVILDTAFRRNSIKKYSTREEMDPEDPKGLLWMEGRDYRMVTRGERQHHLVSALIRFFAEKFDGALLVVLLLGSFADVSVEDEATAAPPDKYHVGLILRCLNVDAVIPWKRLGICIWQYEYGGVIPEADACLHSDIAGHGDRSTCWRHLSDSFG
ncbi:MAG: hypothetical protein Q9213_000166 [Squamulea squamosa]